MHEHDRRAWPVGVRQVQVDFAVAFGGTDFDRQDELPSHISKLRTKTSRRTWRLGQLRTWLKPFLDERDGELDVAGHRDGLLREAVSGALVHRDVADAASAGEQEEFPGRGRGLAFRVGEVPPAKTTAGQV